MDEEDWSNIPSQDAKGDSQMEQSENAAEAESEQPPKPQDTPSQGTCTPATEPDPARDHQSEAETHSRSTGGLRDQKDEKGANDDKEKTKYKIFVIGKTGTGKSSLCNTITETDEFPTGRAFSQITRVLKEKETILSGRHITVVDTPDISTEDEAEQKKTVKTWKESAKGYNYMIVLTVRCDTRYSPAEYEVYKQIKQLWGKDLCRRLVVAFTFGDAREDQSPDMKEELKEVWQELKDVIKDAGERYVVFNNKPGNRDEAPVTHLVEYMQKLKGPEVGRWNEITSIFTGWASRVWCSIRSTVSSIRSTVFPHSNTAPPSST